MKSSGHQDENRVTVLDTMRLYLGESDSSELRDRALKRGIPFPVLAQRIQRAGLISQQESSSTVHSACRGFALFARTFQKQYSLAC